MRERLAQLMEELGCSVSVPEFDVPEARSLASPEEARRLALQETGVDLGTSRIRVGFTRGHLLEVVVQVPLDVEGDEESLQVAAEVLLEECVGAPTLDTWVASVSIDRIARVSGLVMVSDSKSERSAHGIDEAQQLIELGVRGVEVELPKSLLDVPRDRADWTALEIPPSDAAFQGDRRYASTWHPEALKSALEGMPFSSCRFTKGNEIFSWLRWHPPDGTEERLACRAQVEDLVAHEDFSGSLSLCGTGFGTRSDYIDAWCDLSSPELAQFLRSLGEIVGSFEWGLYESAYRKWSLSYPPEG